MIIYKNDVLNKIKNWNDESIHILADFDKTITSGNSDASWGILSKSCLVCKEYVKERQDMYDKYRPIELDENLDYNTKNDLMSEWWDKHINLLIKYKLSEDIINDAAKNLRVMSFREGGKEFLEDMKNRNIPIIIISAGIGNFIEQFLITNNCNFDNIYIVSNFISFENGIAAGISENVIHSLNKNEVAIPSNVKEVIKNRQNIILLGDSISDVRMVENRDNNNVLKIGFLEEKIEENMKYYEEQFDIVCIDNTSFIELFDKVKIFKK